MTHRAWEGISRRYVTRYALVALASAVVLGAAGGSLVGASASALGLLAVPIAGWGVLSHRAWALSVQDGIVAARYGVWSRRRDFLPVSAIQSVTLRQGPWAQLRHVATLRFVVGGGATLTIPFVPADRAHALLRDVTGATGRPGADPTGAAPRTTRTPRTDPARPLALDSAAPRARIR